MWWTNVIWHIHSFNPQDFRSIQRGDPGLGFNGVQQNLSVCHRFYEALLDQFRAIFGSLNMSQNIIVNYLRAIESQPRCWSPRRWGRRWGRSSGSWQDISVRRCASRGLLLTLIMMVLQLDIHRDDKIVLECSLLYHFKIIVKFIIASFCIPLWKSSWSIETLQLRIGRWWVTAL